MRIYIVSLVAVAWLGGCASVVPEAIRTEAPGNVQIAQVRDQPQQLRDAGGRWGGGARAPPRAGAGASVHPPGGRPTPQRFRDAVVRWGGNIVGTRNER